MLVNSALVSGAARVLNAVPSGDSDPSLACALLVVGSGHIPNPNIPQSYNSPNLGFWFRVEGLRRSV